METRLPIGIQDFTAIRQEGFLYVDKTALVHRLISGSGRTFFLSRPRRFGKSLLCSTLAAVFEGRRDLFGAIAGKGALAIDSLEWDWKPRPVIRLDLNAGDYTEGKAALSVVLDRELEFSAQKHDVPVEGINPSDRFARLVRNLARKTGERVVVIIDEYDKPLIGTMDHAKLHEEMREALKGFYGVLKSSDACLRFVLLTGVTSATTVAAFSQVSVFSDLNQLSDLTLDARYAALCGITQEELERDFAGEIDRVLSITGKNRERYLVELREYYNGYRFSENPVTVYNPFGLLNHFDKDGKFSPYWYATSTPTFLMKRIREEKFEIPNLINNVRASYADIMESRIDRGSPLALLYQSGYLTIRDFDEQFSEYILGFPNGEVKYAFLNSLLSSYISLAGNIKGLHSGDFSRDLIKGDIEGFMTRIASLFENIPYDTREPTEHFFQSIVLVLWTLLGQYVQGEARTAKGRCDAVAAASGAVYVFEFKTAKKPEDAPAALEEALAQIDERRYTGPYQASGRRVFKIGAVYECARRELALWKIVEGRGD